MSSFESFLPLLDEVVNLGRGIVADIIGEPHDAYRLITTSSPAGIVDAHSRIATNVGAKFQRHEKQDDLEIKLPGKTLLYTAALDIIPYLVGDTFVLRADAYRPDGSIYTLASKRPMPRVPIFVATPYTATIARPNPNPAQVDSGRAPASVDIERTDKQLAIVNGQYAFQTGPPAIIYVGLVMERLREYPSGQDRLLALEDDTRRVTWSIYVPPTPGVTLKFDDVVTLTATTEKFEVQAVQALPAAFFGSFLSTQSIR